jgi:hypothetical protein
MVSAHKSDGFAAVPSGPLPAAESEKRRADITSVSAQSVVVPRQARLGAAVEALDGRLLTRGIADVAESAGPWTARLTQLDRPGVIASIFFAERARDIVLRLDDGRQARARIASTSFIASSERVCELVGVEPLT